MHTYLIIIIQFGIYSNELLAQNTLFIAVWALIIRRSFDGQFKVVAFYNAPRLYNFH